MQSVSNCDKVNESKQEMEISQGLRKDESDHSKLNEDIEQDEYKSYKYEETKQPQQSIQKSQIYSFNTVCFILLINIRKMTIKNQIYDLLSDLKKTQQMKKFLV